jgi:hypothetical protein
LTGKQWTVEYGRELCITECPEKSNFLAEKIEPIGIDSKQPYRTSPRE